MMKFNKKQAIFKRSKNFLFAVISCLLLALANGGEFSTAFAVREVTYSIVFDYDENILTGTQGQTLGDVTFPDNFPTPSVLDGESIEGTWKWEGSNTTLDTVGAIQYNALFWLSDLSYANDKIEGENNVAYNWKDVGEIVGDADANPAVRIPLTVNVTAAEQP